MSNHVLIVPKGRIDQVPLILQKSQESNSECPSVVHECLCAQPNPKTTEYYVPVIHEDGTIQELPLCYNCTLKSLKMATSKFYQESSNSYNTNFFVDNQKKLDIIQICPSSTNNPNWPKVLFGSVIMALMKSDQSISNLTKVWLTGVINQTLRRNFNDFIFCPEHPREMYNIDDTNIIVCKKCGKILKDLALSK